MNSVTKKTTVLSAQVSAILSNRSRTFGYARLATVAPRLKIGDTSYNAGQIVKAMIEAEAAGVDVLLTPELSLTAYTCGDLFHNRRLLDGAEEALAVVQKATVKDFHGIVFVGMPVIVRDRLYNCAVAVANGEVLGVVPKTYLPNYKEFYEARWFSPAPAAEGVTSVRLLGVEVPFGVDLLFQAGNFSDLIIGVEVCEDLWAVIPPSNYAALAGARLILNLSTSNELVGKGDYRKDLVVGQSGRLMCAYAYVSSGVDESTSDVAFGGHSLIAENGSILKEGKRFQRDAALLISDIDLERLSFERLVNTSFGEAQRETGRPEYRVQTFRVGVAKASQALLRHVEAHPFVPKNPETLNIRCEEIFNIQVNALARRLEKLGLKEVTIGVSGGLDSTLALLVTVKAFDLLGLDRKGIKGYTLPGFGTTGRTKGNALALMEQLAISSSTVDIRSMCLAQMLAEGHKPFGIDLTVLAAAARAEYLAEARADVSKEPELSVEDRLLQKFELALIELQATGVELKDLHFENVQARARTKILMDNGFTIGTGDLSELAIGWCTYNGDHMSMYGVNCSIPKTLVKFLVAWAAEHEFEGETRRVLLDIVDTEISPELLPPGKDGKIAQKTESLVGPYELTDFFIFNMLRNGFRPEKVFFLAKFAQFDGRYDDLTLSKWLKTFIRRFFNSQFKRNCVPDGIKVGSVSLSPRGDWRMPSDAEVALWLTWVEELEAELLAVSATTAG
jgi:NAD+ synthase (glutamine-hydrolysing)